MYSRHHLSKLNGYRNTATSKRGTRFAFTSTIFFFLPCITHEIDQTSINATRPTSLEQYMSDDPSTTLLASTRVAKYTRMPLHLTAIITGLILSIMSLLTGCAGGESGRESGAGATASLEWNPVPDSSVFAYFVHYGRQSPSQAGSCDYESSVSVDASSATVTNLDPDTRYYFVVSAYNGLESACSEEVSIVTPPASA